MCVLNTLHSNDFTSKVIILTPQVISTRTVFALNTSKATGPDGHKATGVQRNSMADCTFSRPTFQQIFKLWRNTGQMEFGKQCL